MIHICENKAADQQHGNHAADLRLFFCFIDSAYTIHLLPKSEISSTKQSSVIVQLGLCQKWSETPKKGFLTTPLIYMRAVKKVCVHSSAVLKNDRTRVGPMVL